MRGAQAYFFYGHGNKALGCICAIYRKQGALRSSICMCFVYCEKCMCLGVCDGERRVGLPTESLMRSLRGVTVLRVVDPLRGSDARYVR